MKTRLLFFTFFALILRGVSAQTGQIQGVVINNEGKPAEFVSILLKETQQGASSDEKGSFFISNIKANDYTLVASFVGYKTLEQKVKIEEGKTLNLSLELIENTEQLKEIVVSGTYTANRTPTLGKANISSLDLPQSTGVVGSNVIADQQATRLGEVIRNVSGVSQTETRGGVAETFSSRGYSIGLAGAGGSIFKNGTISNTMGFPDASTLESVEVMKGSSALLYGNVSGGVIINMVTKKPRFNWGGQVSMLVGSYNQYKPMIDVYGPISKKLAFRAVGTYENAKSYRDVVNTNRVYVTPSLLYKISDKTDILFQADYLKSHIVPDAGVGAPNSRITITELPEAPRNRFINTLWAYNNTDQMAGFLTINHRFNTNWKLTAIGSIQDTRVKGFGAGVPNAIAANGDYTRTLSAVNTAEKDYTAQINLNGSFKTGKLSHQLLFGSDFLRIENISHSFKFTSSAGVVGTAYDKINIFDFTKYIARTDIPTITDTARTTTPQNRYGVYTQNLITITPKFKILAGLRYSYQTAFQSSILNLEKNAERLGTTADKSDAAFSPKFALIYQPFKATSLYSSYTNSFNTNTGTDIYGNNLKSSIVDQYEVGMKNEFLDGKLSANVSVYKIINSNFAQTALFDKNGNPNTNTNIRELSGETTSDGFEVDFNGIVSKNFYFLLGYGYNFMRYTSTTGTVGSQVEGEQLIRNPRNTVNSSVFYTFETTKLKGLKLGISAFYIGKRMAGNNNVVGLNGGLNNTTTALSSYNAQIPLKGFTTTDISAGYTLGRMSILAKISNLFNVMNYIVHDRYSINPIAPRQFATTLSYKF
ncbi:MAG: TonB-dependent receptor [Saprospiraceae bacterium]|nr:TonB-dependent receptor [Saprospiraceae bacterium]